MARPNPVVIPFPKRFDLQGSHVPAICPFQAAAEQRALMLHRLLNILPSLEGSTFAQLHLGEVCQNARGLLNEMVLLYRSSLAQADGRAGDA